MPAQRRKLYTKFLFIFSTLIFLAPLFLQPKHLSAQTDGDVRQKNEACMTCHSDESLTMTKDGQTVKLFVDQSILSKSPHAKNACLDCHQGYDPDQIPHKPKIEPVNCMSCHTDAIDKHNVHKTAGILVTEGTPTEISDSCKSCHGTHDVNVNPTQYCGNCHTEAVDSFKLSVHSQPDKIPGDHPNCTSCHKGDMPVADWKRADKVHMCSDCHAQTDRMERYNVDPDAVSSYEASFHGKAILRFGMNNAAICTDCHKSHDVLAPNNPAAPTNRNNVAATCGAQGCHPGAKLNFAMSGANHLGLKIKQTPILNIELMFFRALLFGTVLFLLGGVTLDLRKKVFGKEPPHSGRVPGFFIGISFLFFVATLGMAAFEIKGAFYAWLGALVTMGLALVTYVLQPKTEKAKEQQKLYRRWTSALRWQHIFLMISFTLLLVTGLPMRFASFEGVQHAYAIFGGINNARWIHRAAAIVLIITWIWHVLWLLYRWSKAGFSFKSWTMLPTKKDLQDFVTLSKSYLGLSDKEPKFGRFNFKQKLDYFAEYWGMPIMVASGFVLWFPIYWGNRLPDWALSFAYIAHSYEATLAFLAIISWHLYNVHFNPDAFPNSKVWISGMMPRSEMEREHGLELEQIEQHNQKTQ